MKGFYSTLALSCFLSLNVLAQKEKKEELSGDYFLLKGKVYQIDMLEDTEDKASDVQVVVYQGKELYVAFFTSGTGAYSFYLPIGHTYEIWFGGSAYVNKKVSIDATQFPKDRKPRTTPLDIGLFRPIEGYDFPLLNDPFVKIKYDPELDQIGPDMDAIAVKSAELAKYFRKIKKESAKKKT